MRKIFGATTTAALALLATASHAAQTVKQNPCLTAQEANALFMSVAPSMLRSLSATCAESLPAGAYLRVKGAALAERYAAPAAASKAAAIAAFNKISDGAAVDEAMFDLVTGSMIGEIAAGQIKPADCDKASRVAELLDPLPPENLTGLIVLIMEFSGSDEKKGPPFLICKAA